MINKTLHISCPCSYQVDNTSEASYNVDADESSSRPDPYRDLSEKYEALLEVRRNRIIGTSSTPNAVAAATTTITSGPQNLHDELTSGDFSSINTNTNAGAIPPNEIASSVVIDQRRPPAANRNNCSSGDNTSVIGSTNNGTTASTTNGRKTVLRTPTDFSEAETSSSGFADETSNKCTQTDETFLCSIANGEDQFSIYDDAATPAIDSRFRNRPEYRELFKEIFAILKKAAENKDKGDKFPLLDDSCSPCFKVPPVTPAAEELPPFPDHSLADETESIMSSIVSEQSVAMSERITKQERKTIMDTVKKHIEKSHSGATGSLVNATGGAAGGQENKPPHIAKQMLEDGRVLTPFKRQPLEYLAVSVNIRKKNRKKSRGSPLDRSESPLALPSPPRVFYANSQGKKRRDMRSTLLGTTSTMTGSQGSAGGPSGSSTPAPSNMEWNGHSMTVYNRNMKGTAASAANTATDAAGKPIKCVDASSSTRRVEFKRTSAASQDLLMLKQLDLSYAQALRLTECSFHNHHRQLLQQQQQQHHQHNHQHQQPLQQHRKPH